jgi:hypothetical protein
MHPIHLAALAAGHMTRLESQTGFRMTGNEGTLVILVLAIIAFVLVGRAATRSS